MWIPAAAREFAFSRPQRTVAEVLALACFGTSPDGALGASTNPSRWIRELARASFFPR